MSTPETYDVVVVGSGPSGSAWARTILDGWPTARVLMVEIGPVVSDPPGRHVRTIADPDERLAAQLASQGSYTSPDDLVRIKSTAHAVEAGLSGRPIARPGTWLLDEADAVLEGEDGLPAAALSSNVGGMGAHWTGACPTPGAGEWPEAADREQLLDSMARARELLCVTQRAFESAPLGAEVRAMLAAAYDPGRPPDRRVQPMPLALRIGPGGERLWSGTDQILGALAPGTAGFEIRPLTTAREILMSGSRARGVRLHDRRTDREYEVYADAVVVAADTLRAPQVLFASGIRPRALGHYLNDQPQVAGVVRLDPRFSNVTEGTRRADEGSVDILSGVSWVPFEQSTFPYSAQVMQMDAAPIPVDPDFETWPGSIVETCLFGPKDLRFGDCVELDESRLDAFGLPAMKIHYRLTDKDHQTIDDMIAEATKMGALIGDPVNGAAPGNYVGGSSIHYHGTMRLGTDPEDSVCDPTLRVWGTDNVYAGGNGAIPTPIACNPTLTNVSLSVLGARALVADRH
jgi:choline dehydrogenase-like flavoprotein